MAKSWTHTTLNLTEIEIKKKKELEEKTQSKFSYIAIFKLGLENLLKQHGLKD